VRHAKGAPHPSRPSSDGLVKAPSRTTLPDFWGPIGPIGEGHDFNLNMRRPRDHGSRYSILRASVGEMDAARKAGIMVAKKAERASALAARVSANGSQLRTP